MNTKSVQVVMSTYNGEKYLKEQIDIIQICLCPAKAFWKK